MIALDGQSSDQPYESHPIETEIYSFAPEDRKCGPGQGEYSSGPRGTAEADFMGICPLDGRQPRSRKNEARRAPG